MEGEIVAATASENRPSPAQSTLDVPVHNRRESCGLNRADWLVFSDEDGECFGPPVKHGSVHRLGLFAMKKRVPSTQIARQHITRFIVRSQQFVDLTAQFEVSGANPAQIGRALLSGELEGLGKNRYLTIGRIVHHNTRKCAPSC